jgi:hypothetical protein
VLVRPGRPRWLGGDWPRGAQGQLRVEAGPTLNSSVEGRLSPCAGVGGGFRLAVQTSNAKV